MKPIGGSEAGDSSRDPSRDSDWLLDGLAIRPPLEEFRRIFEVKKRAFEGKVDADSQRKYDQVRRLGERFILDQQAGEDSC
ncbi:MAG: hypothetical protein GWP41_10700 [Planctomycetia bacterium]|jgi:hypothetical protein|nr:hypothetical protein [Planctomycetia bacterium]NCG00139.1 hypothetical protein [Planctomycetia bacterium]NCG13096.1 hypothetical protein [Planctomycetia bacterium]NCG56967.1 hypothetical protein [Pseudomonadota bacterium]